MSSHPQLFAILSCRYSGSTVLDYMLGSHSAALSLTELRAFVIGGRKPFTCKTCHPPDSCPIWTRSLTEKLLAAGQSSALYQEIARQSGCHILIDSSKKVSWFKGTLREFPPENVVCLHISKSPEEYAGSERSKLHKSRLHRIPDIAESWWRTNAEILDFLDRSSFPAISLRYRDLVDHPADLLTHILDHAGLNYERGIENFWNFKHHPLWGNKGTRSHIKDSDSQPDDWTDETELNKKIYQEHHQTLFRDEKWRQVIKPEEVDQLFNSPRVDSMAKLLGYAHPTTLEGQALNDPAAPLSIRHIVGSERLSQDRLQRRINPLYWRIASKFRRRWYQLGN